MSVRNLVLVAAAATLALAVIPTLLPVASALPAAAMGGPDGSAWSYKWVDSTAPGCKAPSLIGSGIPSPAIAPANGCPLGWDEIAGTGCIWYNGYQNDYAYGNWCTWSTWDYCGGCWNYAALNFYGTTYYSYNWMLNENGFIKFCTSPGPSMGTSTRDPVAMPTAPLGGGTCASSATATDNPANLLAAYWTNMRVNYYGWLGGTYVGYSGCWDNPSTSWLKGAVWLSGKKGVAPLEYVVMEWDHVLVNPADGACNAWPTPNKYATFQVKIYPTINVIDVIWKPGSYPTGGADNNAQPTSLGIENAAGDRGLNYAFDTNEVLTDRSVRYYPTHTVLAKAKAITLSEDCTSLAKWPTSACSTTCVVGPSTCPAGAAPAIDPITVAFDPDYGDTVTFNVNPPGKGIMTNTGASTGNCNKGTCTYAPHPNFNGADSATYTVTSSDGSSASATISMTVNAINDPPINTPILTYPVIADSFLYVMPASGLLATAQDPEVAPLRGSWGTNPPTPSTMTEGGPLQTMRASRIVPFASGYCPGYSGTGPAGSAWNPTKGTLTTFNTDGSFQYTPNPGIGAGMPPPGTPDYYRYCVQDINSSSGTVISSSPIYNVKLDISGWTNADLIAKSDMPAILEDSGAASLSVSANDYVSPAATGVSYQLVGSPPANAVPGSFNINSATGAFTYTPSPDWFGSDIFQYKITSTNKGESNIATVVVTVNPVNDQPTFTWWRESGDQIVEDNGATTPVPPLPYVRTLNSFVIGISPGPPNESSQTVSGFVTKNSNPGLFNVAPTITATGTAAQLKYTTKPNVNGLADICFRLKDSGGTASGGIDSNPLAPAELCFPIQILPQNDAPVAVADTFTMFKDKVLEAPAPAVTFPIAKAAVPNIMANDKEYDDEPIKAVKGAGPTVYGSKVEAFNEDGSFRYRPKAGFVGTDTFKYKVVDKFAPGLASAEVVVTIIVKDNKPPTADLTVGTDKALLGESIAFTSYCKDPDGPIVLWLWDFGDGTTSTETSPSHAYSTPGTYTVTLKCFDAAGEWAMDVGTVDAGWGLAAGEADVPAAVHAAAFLAYAGENILVDEGDKVRLHGSAHGALDDSKVRYSWTQVSGTPAIQLDGAETAEPTFTAPSYDGSGPKAFVFQLVAFDGVATSLPSVVQVTVASTNHLPTADAGAAQRIKQGLVATLDASGSSDPDGDQLKYQWTQVSGATASLADPTAARTTFTVPPYDGTPLTFQLVVSDAEGSAQATTSVLALPPDASASGFTYDVVRTARGSEVVFHPMVSGDTYLWDFGDQVGSSGEREPTYEYGAPGSYEVRLSVIGEDGSAVAYSRVVVISPVEQGKALASPIEHTSPAAGLLALVLVLGCAVLASRRRL